MSKRTYEHPGFEYKEVPVQDSIQTEAQNYSNQGWETVSVIPPAGVSRSFSLLIKRVKANPYDRMLNSEEFEKWSEWDNRFGGPFTHRIRSA